jgi:hypothetical protein
MVRRNRALPYFYFTGFIQSTLDKDNYFQLSVSQEPQVPVSRSHKKNHGSDFQHFVSWVSKTSTIVKTKCFFYQEKYNHSYVGHILVPGGRDSSVGKATRYRLDGSEFEPGWRQEIFSSRHPFTPALRPTQPPVQWINRPGRGADHPPPSSADVQTV